MIAAVSLARRQDFATSRQSCDWSLCEFLFRGSHYALVVQLAHS